MGLKIDFSKVQAKLDEMSKKMQGETLNEALEAGAKPVIDALKRNSPYNSKNNGKHLKDTLDKIKIKGSKTNKTIEVGVNSEDRNIIERAYYNHYGTCCIAGNHFMNKAFDESKVEANEEIKKVLKEKLNV